MGPHKKDWGMGHDEDSRTRPGEKDYTGHPRDKSTDRPGHEDYKAHKGTKSKTHEGRDYEGDEKRHHTPESVADHVAKEARDGPHMLELLDEEGWELVEKDGRSEVKEFSEEEVAEQLGMRPSKAPHISVIRLTAAKNGLRKGNKG